jgi:deoxyribose-phosphate aldolase
MKDANFCKYCDLHINEVNYNKIDLRSCISVYEEHGFNHIFANLFMMPALMKNTLTSSSVKYGAILDPMGINPPEVRKAEIQTAVLYGVDAVEIAIPSYLSLNKCYDLITQDLEICTEITNKAKISLTITTPLELIKERNVNKRIATILKEFPQTIASNNNGMFADSEDMLDDVLCLKRMAKDTNFYCGTKIYVENPTCAFVLQAIKSDISRIGMPWEKAANIIHGVQNKIRESNDN